nr:hypothetical protein [Desulfobacterales bacterium]
MRLPDEIIKQPRAKTPKLSPEDRVKGFMEVELESEEEAVKIGNAPDVSDVMLRCKRNPSVASQNL